MSDHTNILEAVRDVSSREPPTHYDGGNDSDADDNGQNTTRILIIAILVVLVIVLLYYVMAPRSLAARLAKCGWILYTREGCGYCTKQLHELGGHYSRRVHCAQGGKQLSSTIDSSPLSCSQISGFPTFYSTRTKETKVGLQKRHDLEKMLKPA